MKKLIALFTVLPVLLTFMLGGCTLSDPDSSTDLVAPSGDQLFSNYVSMGNSLTSGFMDGGLSIAGQMSSYPKLIAGQIGAAEFNQPYFAMPGVSSRAHASSDTVNGILYWDGSSPVPLGVTPLATVQSPTSGFHMAIALPTPYDNLGVPGATTVDVLNAYSAVNSTPLGNSFFDLINRPTFFGNVSVPAVPGVSPAYESNSMFSAAVASGPKLVTLWIGNNEILGPAMDGTSDGIVDAVAFETDYTTMLMALAGGLVNRNGFPSTIVVANIPDIASTAYFIPRAFLEGAVPYGMGIVWPNYDEADAEFLTIPGLGWILAMTAAENWTASVPAENTLSVAEAGEISDAVTAYNDAIGRAIIAVNTAGLANCDVMDANGLLAAQDPTALTHFMILLQAMGGDIPLAAGTTMFSLDGVHPNNVGYGIVANGFIAKINEMMGTEIADVDLSGLSWDPTYGMPLDPGKVGQPYHIDPEVAEGMGAIFR